MDREITSATSTNHAAMVATLAAAFIRDPALCWIIADPGSMERRLTHFFNTSVRASLAHGYALRSASDEVVTLWRVPGAIHAGFFESLISLPNMVRSLGFGLGRGQSIAKSLHHHAPKHGHYHYLQFAGVSPAHQGKGWGGAAIRAGLQRARESGLPAYLETATESNVSLYQRLGFVIVDEWNIPGGGPHFWGMLWEPDPA
jgi:ribosomal protein S18 acetylase RimI-like enzyme